MSHLRSPNDFVARGRQFHSIEPLEPRRLLSQTIGMDTTFGTGGYVAGYLAQGVLPNGDIVAYNSAGKLDLLDPDGTFSSHYSGSLVPPPPPSAAEKRYSVSVEDYTNFDGATRGEIVVKHYAGGQLDPSFGNHGVNVYQTGEPTDLISLAGEVVGPDGSLYVGYNADNYGNVVRFGRKAGTGDQFLAGGGADYEIDGLTMESDGRLIIVEAESYGWTLVRMPKNVLTPEDGGPGVDTIPVGLPSHVGTNPGYFSFVDTGGLVAIRADGEALISGGLTDQPISPSNNFTFAVNLGQFTNKASASGRVYNDINGNGKPDAREPGLPYAQVYADVNNNGVYDTGEPTAYANAIGEYTLKNLAPGKFIIREVRQSSWVRTQPAGVWPGGAYTVTLAANQQKSNLNFGNVIADHHTGSISGVVYNDYNGDQKQDNGEKGLAGWRVYADTNDNGIYDLGEPTAVTNSSGAYTLTGLQQGGYRIREVRQNGWVRMQPFGDWPAGSYDVGLNAGKSRGGFAFGNAKGTYGSIQGVLYIDNNENGKLDAGDQPLKGVVMDLFGSQDSVNPEAYAVTDSTGKFIFSNVPAGAYSLFDYNGLTLSLLRGNLTGQNNGKYSVTILSSQTVHAVFFLY